MKGLLSAWRFLTVFRFREEKSELDLRSASLWFPVVGLALGLGLAGFDWLIRPIFPVTVRSALDLAVLLFFTGCLHMDGLADTADGFLSSRPKERILEIMRDSHSGAMAVIVVAANLLLKWTALSALEEGWRFGLLVLAPVLGRSAILFLMGRLSYARTQGGLATAFTPGVKAWGWGMYFGVAAAVAFLLWQARGFSIVGGALIFATLFARFCSRKIGGYTGDTLGAACELTETVVLLVAVGVQ